jgi:hypothetical protein
MVGLLGLFACGRTEQKVELKNELLSDVSDPNCKKGSCPEVEYTLVDGSGSSIESKVYEGTVGVPLKWPVSVKSSAPAGRIKLELVEKPTWLVKEASGTPGSIFITNKPNDMEFVSDGFLVILARDIGRCIALEKLDTYASGRTDTGVHALIQIIHFDTGCGTYANAYLVLLSRSPNTIHYKNEIQ